MKNKIAQGFSGMVVVVILLSSILAASLFYQNGITANAVKENSSNVVIL